MATYCLAILPALLGFISLLLGLVSGIWCRLVYLPANPNFNFPSRSGQSSSFDTANLPSTLPLGVYLFREANVATSFDSCVIYSFPLWQEASGGWKTVIVTQPISWALAFLLCFCLLISTCCPFPKMAYRSIGALLALVCCPLQALVFLVLSSNMCTANPQLKSVSVDTTTNALDLGYFSNSCQLGTGGYLAIGATVGYFVSGILCCCLTGSSGAATMSSGGTTATPVSKQSAPSRVPAAVVAGGAAAGGASAMSNGSRVQPQTASYPTNVSVVHDEENPAMVGAAIGGAAVVGAGAGAMVAAHERNRRESRQAHMSYEEQRELVQAAAMGAAVGASARADSLHNVPAVVRLASNEEEPDETLMLLDETTAMPPVSEILVKEDELGDIANPDEQAFLVVAAASGAAVGARARADTTKEDEDEKENELLSEGNNVADESDVDDEVDILPTDDGIDQASTSNKRDPPSSSKDPSGAVARSSGTTQDSNVVAEDLGDESELPPDEDIEGLGIAAAATAAAAAATTAVVLSEDEDNGSPDEAAAIGIDEIQGYVEDVPPDAFPDEPFAEIAEISQTSLLGVESKEALADEEVLLDKDAAAIPDEQGSSMLHASAILTEEEAVDLSDLNAEIENPYDEEVESPDNYEVYDKDQQASFDEDEDSAASENAQNPKPPVIDRSISSSSDHRPVAYRSESSDGVFEDDSIESG